MCLQGRRAPAARFGCTTPSLVKALHPFDCRTWADVELLGCLTSRSPAFDVCVAQHANVRRICLRHRSPPDESMPPDSPIYRSLGILRFYSARTCSSQCEELHFSFSAGMSLNQCVMNAQPYIAQWINEHPKWVAMRWRCDYGGSKEKT